MAELSNTKTPERNPFEELAVVYVLYFDEAQGHLPLLIYPDDRYKDDKKFMRPIKFHPVWFLSVGETEALDHIDLEFKGYTFFGKKFITSSRRKKRRAGLEEETPETMVIIVSLPNDLEIFGDDLIKRITSEIKTKFEDKLFEVIESEILKEGIIKSPKVKEIIKIGDEIKEDLRVLIEKISNQSLKMQKAISYLALKGIDVSHISSEDYKNSFSSIKLFDPKKESKVDFTEKVFFSINEIFIMEDSQEFEIIAKNDSEKEFHNLLIKITNVKEYFEKEIMNEFIDIWFPGEQLVFISPIIPHVHEYLFFIIEGNKNERIFSKRIDLNILRNKKN